MVMLALCRMARLTRAVAAADMLTYGVAWVQALARALDFKINDPALILRFSDKGNDGLVQRVYLVAL